MKILIKYPTRGRPNKCIKTLEKYINLAIDIDNIKIIVSIDDDDKTVSENMFRIHSCVEVISGPSLGKIHAINRDIPDTSIFDILLLASDDMIPEVKGYDDIIRNKMKDHFPDMDGVLFFNDGYKSYHLNTLAICGSKYYSRFGYIYCPEYKSLWCDNEFTDEANRLGRQIYIDNIIIKHEHRSNNVNIRKDDLYIRNQKYYLIDKNTYKNRKFRNYDISVMIPTIPSRKKMFIDLCNYINKLKQQSRLTIEVIYDDRIHPSIGEKRNYLLDMANGKYCCFIDDDDIITEDYFKVIEESELKYDCISLNAMYYINGIKDKSMVHSMKYRTYHSDHHTYYRPPNHLNPMRTEIARRIRFPKIKYGEDFDFAMRLVHSGLIKTEYISTKLQYLYMYIPNKPHSRQIINSNLNPSIIRAISIKVAK